MNFWAISIANSAGVVAEHDVQSVVQTDQHAPMIDKVLHALADLLSQNADEVRNVRLLGSLRQRVSAASPMSAIPCSGIAVLLVQEPRDMCALLREFDSLL